MISHPWMVWETMCIPPSLVNPSSCTHRSIAVSSIAGVGFTFRESMNDVLDCDVGPEQTPTGECSPIDLRAINFLDDDVGHNSTPVGVRSPIACRAIKLAAVREQFTSGDSIVESSMSGDRFTSHDGATSKNPDHCHSTINYLMVDGNKTSAVSHPLNDFCHTFASKSGASSMRSRAAASASLHKSSSQLWSRSAIKHHLKRKKKKMAKQSDLLAIIGPTNQRAQFGMNYSTQFLKENVVVFDGGVDIATAPLSNPEVSGWCCHRIADGHLEICPPPSCYQGLMYKDGERNPNFILLPRNEALKINSDARALCNAMSNVSKKNEQVGQGC